MPPRASCAWNLMSCSALAALLHLVDKRIDNGSTIQESGRTSTYNLQLQFRRSNNAASYDYNFHGFSPAGPRQDHKVQWYYCAAQGGPVSSRPSFHDRSLSSGAVPRARLQIISLGRRTLRACVKWARMLRHTAVKAGAVYVQILRCSDSKMVILNSLCRHAASLSINKKCQENRLVCVCVGVQQLSKVKLPAGGLH